MTNVSARALACCVVALATISILSADTQRQDTAAVVAFQRSADSYTFLHRQVERKLGPAATDAQMIAALRDARASAKAGDLFASEIAGAFRTRIASTLRASNCVLASVPGEDLSVPRINQEIATAVSLPECLSGVLPRAFIFLTTPVSAHVIARASYKARVQLWEGTVLDERRLNADERV